MAENADTLADADIQNAASVTEFDEQRARGTQANAGDAEKAAVRSRHMLIALTVLFAVSAVLFQLLVTPILLERIRDGWSSQATFVGISRTPDEKTGLFGPPVTTHYHRSMTIDGPGPVKGSVRIKDDYLLRDVKTGAVVWRYTLYPVVSRATGEYVEPAYRGEHLIFPRNTERKVYVLRQNYLDGYPLHYVKDDVIDGIRTYVFEYQGVAEYTDSYRGSVDYPGVAIAPGQEIKCADDQFYYRAWIEPLSGSTLKISEGCESGGYKFDIVSGRRLEPVLVWSGDTEGANILERADRARDRRVRIVLANYLPPALAALALIAGTAALSYGRGRA